MQTGFVLTEVLVNSQENTPSKSRLSCSVPVYAEMAGAITRKPIMHNLNSAPEVLNALTYELLIGRFIASRGLGLALLI